MTHRNNFLVALLVYFSFNLLNVDIINSVYAEQKNIRQEQSVTPNRIYGKVTDIIDASGYTYAEVDTGNRKVWAAAPVTQLKIGDMIAFSTGMPMENFHSKSMNRNFSVVYFTTHFITDKEPPTSKAAAIASPHKQIKQKQVRNPVKGINKVKGGNTIAEIYTDKQSLSGKTIRVRGQVTRFTAKVMGKNWLHIRDSSTLDDLTITTDGKAAIDDVVVIEGNLELNKNYGYGYVYPIIVEDARITKK